LDVVAAHGVTALFWNRRYGPAEREIDTAIKARCLRQGVEAHSYAGSVLVEPFALSTGAGKPYSVFTPFWKTLKQQDIPAPLPRPKGQAAIEAPQVDVEYQSPRWAEKLARHWEVGEAAARERLDDFLDDAVERYPEGRDIPGDAATSRLSPHLAFGEISPRQVWHAAQAVAQHAPEKAAAIDKFLSEVAWRDFNYHQFYHRENIATEPMMAKYRGLPWRDDAAGFNAWTTGRTGFPIVDAGMRELWETGTMHNRVRMLTASLLAKNLLVDWRLGEQWFWDTLVDADPASNPGNWQWVAGSGLDASPYFRIFNPVVQGERFDAKGDYVRRWVPELAGLPDEWVQKPFEAPSAVLSRAKVDLGKTYPHPIVDLKGSRTRALEALQNL
jgi:deoxyribodipyrimidine photo-lyase